MLTLRSARLAEEGISGDIINVEQSLRISKQLKFNKKTIKWQEKELRDLKKAKQEIHKEIEKIQIHEITIKKNKERKEWFKKHPNKTLIDFHEAVTIPHLKKINERLKRKRY